MNLKKIAGFVLLAVSVILLVFLIQEVNGSFVFYGPRSASYSQPYPGHALKLILVIVGIIASFLTGLFLIGLGRKNR